ncbi:MAG: thiamine phosphate synthase [Lachnospira eligens]
MLYTCPRERLIEVAGSVNIPVVAIGGIDYDNCGELAGTGVDGIAVVSAIFAADDPGLATKELYLKTGRVFNYHRDFIFDMDGTILDSMPYWRNVSKNTPCSMLISYLMTLTSVLM